MSQRFVPPWVMALALVAVFGVSFVRAQQPSTDKLVRKVYSVADLVTPTPTVTPDMIPCPTVMAIPTPMPTQVRSVGPDGLERIGFDFNVPVSPPPLDLRMLPAQRTEPLVQLIANSVAPRTWAGAGGNGSIAYWPTGMSLVVEQTEKVHAQIDELLAALRKMHDIQVALEVRAVRIKSEDFADVAQAVGMKSTMSTTIDEAAAMKLLADLEKQDGCIIVMAPKLTTFNGQQATISVCDNRMFVTGMRMAPAGNAGGMIPSCESLTTGTTINVCPTVAPDSKLVSIRFHAEVAEMPEPEVALLPVTTFVTPTFEGGAQGQPIPFTQFIQQPLLAKRSVTKSVSLVDGSTAVIDAGQCERVEREVTKAVLLGDLPILGDLFTVTRDRRICERLVYLVTPRVITSADRPAAPAVKGVPIAAPLPTCAPIAVVQATNAATLPPAVPLSAMPRVLRADAVIPAPPVMAYPAMTSGQILPCPPPSAPAMTPSTAACCTAPTPCAPMMLPAPAITCPNCLPPCGNVQTMAACAQAPSTKETLVAIKATIMTLSDDFLAKLAAGEFVEFVPTAGQPAKPVEPHRALEFLKSAKQCGCEVVSQPTVMTADGQSAVVSVGEEKRFVTGIDLVAHEGTAKPEFRMTQVKDGLTMTMVPQLSADGRFVQLRLEADICKVADAKPAGCKVTLEGADGTRTEQVTMPMLDVVQCQSTMVIPFGKTMLLYPQQGGTQRHLILVTPGKLEPATTPVSFEFACVGCGTRCTDDLPTMMKKYREACAAGQKDVAKALAAKCLELDPTCFSRGSQ